MILSALVGTNPHHHQAHYKEIFALPHNQFNNGMECNVIIDWFVISSEKRNLLSVESWFWKLPRARF
ncbi:hypothetical protein QVD17_27222 [Tagetes erecta]|uniref:Uncharacterized protein n=1 Tax=Tagetes erecta TaxID=13708 RepID=A0AAD8NRF8_TARER|nr:hypothetical protein QVD17_27222 [Tagetes erecta]